MTITFHGFMDAVTYTSFATSLIYSVLPTVETFKDYPNFQRRYGLFLDILKQLGANLRNKVYPQIQTAGGSQISDAAAKNVNPNLEPKP